MTHPNILDSAQSLILIIDIQPRLTAVMPETEASYMLTQVDKLLQAAQLLAVPVFLTEQYPLGLGATHAEISQQLPVDSKSYAKTCFSAGGIQELMLALQKSGRRQIILCGQETHICVLQTALELLQQGFKVYLLEDAVCSRHALHKYSALQRLQQQGVTLVCLESVLFEWLKDAKHLHFKRISTLIR
jgi:nicotinamidase-related amidase